MISMYTDGELQRYNQICLQGMDNSSTDIVVAYPSRAADDIAEFLAEALNLTHRNRKNQWWIA